MRIGLNIVYCAPGQVGGTQTYAENLMAEFAQIDTDDEFVVYTNIAGKDVAIPDAGNFRTVICPVDAKRLPARYAFEQFELPRRMAQDKIDVGFSLGYVCPLNLPCKNVVCIHDVNFIALSDAMSQWKRMVFGQFVRQSAKRSDHVITVSEFSKREIVERIGIGAEKVTVTRLAAREYVPSPSASEIVAQLFGLTTPYLIAFSSHSHHKNISRLLDAFASIQGRCEHDLVLVGRVPADGLLAQRVRDLGLQDRVKITGYVKDDHVMPLIAGADLFVFPSYYEGFGLPALDAQQTGTALATARAGSLPEVAGDGAAYFDPYSVDDMAEVICRCLNDEGLRRDLAARGRDNLGLFSWRLTAETTLEILRGQA